MLPSRLKYRRLHLHWRSLALLVSIAVFLCGFLANPWDAEVSTPDHVSGVVTASATVYNFDVGRSPAVMLAGPNLRQSISNREINPNTKSFYASDQSGLSPLLLAAGISYGQNLLFHKNSRQAYLRLDLPPPFSPFV